MEKMREYADKANDLVMGMNGIQGVGYNTKDITVYHSDEMNKFEVMKKLSDLSVDIFYQNVGNLKLNEYEV